MSFRIFEAVREIAAEAKHYDISTMSHQESISLIERLIKEYSINRNLSPSVLREKVWQFISR